MLALAPAGRPGTKPLISVRILQLATSFIPQRGGIETVSALLAREFLAAGHASVVLTRLPQAEAPVPGVAVVRAPSAWRVLREIVRADAVVMHGIPLRLAWPLAFIRRRAIIVRHMWDPPAPSWLRTLVARRYPSYAVSRYLSTVVKDGGAVLANPYDASVFREAPPVARDRALVFLGRVTRDKGILDFVHLVAALAGTRPTLQATVIGEGPDRTAAESLASDLGVATRLRWTGALSPEAAAAELRRHQVLVFPALWDEPFGLVALEAPACGTVVAAYASGGIPEAVGPCGATVPTGQREQLAATCAHLLNDAGARARLLALRDRHLAAHHPAVVARHYLSALGVEPPVAPTA